MNEKILIIDDDEEMCEELAEILKAEGYHVNFSISGIAGYNLFKENPYDLIILDLKLPDVRGIEILENIKNRRPAQKVLVLSGKPLGTDIMDPADLQSDREVLYKMADVLLNKPVKPEFLLEKVKGFKK